MTVGEMIKQLNRYNVDMVVEIYVKNPSVGPSRGTNLKGIGRGIDWDKDRLFIFPEKMLVEVI